MNAKPNGRGLILLICLIFLSYIFIQVALIDTSCVGYNLYTDGCDNIFKFKIITMITNIWAILVIGSKLLFIGENEDYNAKQKE